jgi:polyhydroxyalkanoate synthase
METKSPLHGLPSPLDVTEAVAKISAHSHHLLQRFMDQQSGKQLQDLDPLGVLPAFAAFTQELNRNPAHMFDLQAEAWQTYFKIVNNSAQRLFGLDPSPVVENSPGDRRFTADDWEKNPLFAFVRQTYLANGQLLRSMVADSDGLDEKTARKVAFYMDQFIDAVAPTNFAMTNPQVLHATVETGGQNLLDGLKNFLEDIDPIDGTLRMRMVDSSAFELGKNVAISPGKVVYQNELMQLIQYAPTTEQVYQRPLLIVPPWINKFYILDLQPKNSFIKAAVEQGLTVFVVSWVNPDESLANKDFVDYMAQGPLAALTAIEQATGESSCNVIGYCLGGTLIAATLAVMKARGDERIHSATFFTAMIDFSEPGDLGVFIDEEQLTAIEATMAERGYLDGAEMASTFNMLRANDLIWSFVVNNYLLGRKPMAFDLLFWNADSTRMPARMHSTYLREMYLENKLCQPGAMQVDGTPVDIGQIDVPVCFVSALEDHIAPWKSTFQGAGLFRSEVKFILSQAGHIAGIINPPGPRQYGHYAGPTPKGTDADTWLAEATHHETSWWPTWMDWIAGYSGDKVAARDPAGGGLTAIEDAPGSYVRVRNSANAS